MNPNRGCLPVRAIPNCKERATMERKLIITAQVFISGQMACLMTGIFTFLHMGWQPGFFAAWGWGFVQAWPIAFVLSMATGPVGFLLAGRVMRKKFQPQG